MRNIIYLGKLLLANKVIKSLFLLHPLLILVITLSTEPSISYWVTQETQLFNNFKGLAIYFYAWTILCHVCLLLCLDNLLPCLLSDLHMSRI